MGALNRIKRVLARNPPKSSTHSERPSARARTVKPEYSRSGMGKKEIWASYLKCAPVNAAVNTIAEKAIKNGWIFEDLKKGAPTDRAEDIILEKAERLISDPGDGLDDMEFLKSVVLSLVLFGDVFIEVQHKTIKLHSVDDPESAPVLYREPFKFYILPTLEMSIRATDGGEVVGYEQNHQGRRILFDKSEVLHISYNRMPGGLYGTPKVVAAQNLIATWLRAIEYNHDYYFTKGRPKAIISLGSISSGELDRIIESIKADMDSEGGGYTFLNTPEVSVATLSDSNKDMEFSTMVQYLESRILSIFEVPKIMIGISETGGAGMVVGDTQVGSFYDMVESLNATISSAFNRYFKETLGLSRYAFKIRSPRPLIDPALVGAYATLLDKTVLVPNEVRELLGLEPLEGGDEPLSPSAPGIPLTMTVSSTEVRTASHPTDQAAGGSDNSGSPVRFNESHPWNRPGGIYEDAVARAAKITAEFTRDLKSGIRRIYEETLRGVERSEKKIIDPESFKAEVLGILDEATGKLEQTSRATALEIWAEGEVSVVGESALKLGGPPPEDVLKTLNTYYGEVPIKTFSDDLAAKITTAIEESVASGDISLYKMTSTMQDNIETLVDAESWKLERIERTRYNRIATESRRSAMVRSGIKGYQRKGIRDGRQSPICAELDGKIFPIEDREHLPPSHPNCRCVILPLSEMRYKEALENGEVVGVAPPNYKSIRGGGS